ncbi:MAG: hypothetical protein N4A33_10185 [Bacteriovoracaceae bacterium]|jgi:RHS repeat-associated protein|nr:hypothetical protein [Bacteriovoracaceae bacterium]
MKFLFVFLLIFAISCQDSSDNNVTNAVNDSFANNPKPADVQVSPICYEDYHKIESTNVNRKLDILIVPDTSGSIKQERSNIANGFHHLLNSLPDGVDYNIGVMLAHSPDGSQSGIMYQKNNEPHVLKSSELSVSQIKTYLDLKIFSPHQQGQTDGGEVGMLSLMEGLTPAKLAASKMQGIFREDAALAIVFIADEQDICAKLPEGITAVVDRQNAEKKTFVKHCISDDISWRDVIVGGRDYNYLITPQMVVDKVRQIHGNRPLVIGGVLYDENSTIPTGNEDEVGYGYHDIINLVGGINIDLGSGDYGDGLSRLGRLATSTMDFENNFAVKSRYIDPSTLQALVDNNQVSVYYDFELEKIFIDPNFDQLGTIKIDYCTDSTMPTILMDMDKEYVVNASYDLSISANDLYFDKLQVYLADNLIVETVDKNITQNLTLVEGSNEVRVEVFDKVGNKKVAYKTIILDTTDPVLHLANANNLYINSNELTIIGTVSDDYFEKYEIILNGNLVKEVSSVNIDEIISVSDINNTIEVIAYDKVGNTDSKTISVIKDTTAPIVSLLSQDNETVNSSSYTLLLDITEQNLDKVEIYNNDNFIMAARDNFSFNLIEGQNNITYKAFDLAGNESILGTLTVNLDTVGPILSGFVPEDNSVLRTTMHTVSALSNEELASVTINGQNVDIAADKLSFNSYRVEQGEGDVDLLIVATDLIGNQSSYTLSYEVFLKLIRIDLVSLVGHNGKINVIGAQGAALSGLEIDLSGGFFNNTTVNANADGSFEAQLNFTNNVTIEAQNSQLNLDESYELEYKADTTLAGVIKDVNDTPIPGVTVSIVSSGQSVVTDTNGVFNISDPAIGDQRILIDGSTVSEAFTMGQKQYSAVAINYSVGLKERNVMERVIYLSPLLLDGTQTNIIEGQAVTVTSSHAPGVSLQIPADAANFPDGVEQSINMIEIPIDKTSIEVFEGARPDTVFALEPSGLTFSEPVQVTLPNVNDFEAGTKLVIMSKNSSTGLWEIDGAAIVQGNQIVTTPGDGITHFSEIFAAPYGLDVSPMVSESSVTPGFNTAKGSLSTSIRLPSYKTFGEDFAPNFIYKSSWASPNVIVSNIFNLSNYQISRDKQAQAGFVSSLSANTVQQVWTTPKNIKSEFFIADIASGEVNMQAPNAPKQGIVSYAMDLASLNSENYFARSSYEIEYKHFVKSTTRVRTKSLFGRKTRWIRQDQTLFNTVFPEDLQSRVLVQNKKNSEFGQGWKLGLTQEILNPQNDKITIEETDGNITSYVLDNSIETIVHDTEGISVFNYFNNEIKYVDNKSNIQVVDLQTNVVEEDGELNKYSVSVGNTGNLIYYRSTNTFGSYSSTVHNWYCRRVLYDEVISKKITQLYFNNDKNIFLDNLGAIFSDNTLISGTMKSPDPLVYTGLISGFWGLIQPHCQEQIGQNCDLSTPSYFISNKKKDVRTDPYWLPETTRCAPIMQGSGSIPKSIYASGSLTTSGFNKPEDFVPSLTESNIYYVADTGNNLIRKVDVDNNIVTDIAGNQGTVDPVDSLSNVDAISTSIYHPRGIVADSGGRLYISSENGLIRRIDTNGKISTIAGRDRISGPLDTNTLNKLSLRNPHGLALDEDNSYLYVADTNNHRVVRLDLINNTTSQVAGNNLCQSGQLNVKDGDAALTVSICNPKKIALDSNNNLLILDQANKRIRKVNFNSLGSGIKTYKSIADSNTTLKKNLDGSFERVYRDGSKVEFNSLGKQISSIDKNNNRFDFNYNNDGYLFEIVDYTGRKSTLTYSSGLLDTFVDPTGKLTSFTYGDGKLTRIDFSDGSSRSFVYNERGYITEEFNQRGNRQAYEYNDWQRLSKVIAPDNSETSVGETITDSLSNSLANNGELQNYQNEDDENELAKLFTDAKGVETKLLEDLDGFVTKIIDAEGRETNIERDFKGRPTKIIKNDGSYTTFLYNEQGDLLEKYDSSIDKKEEYTYNEYGYPVTTKDVNNKTKSYSYDIAGNLLSQTDENNQTVTRTYYPNGLVHTITNDEGEITTFEYDPITGNLAKRISPMGEQTSYVRDNAGNITQKIDPNNIITAYDYDDFNRLIRVETGISSSNPVGDITAYEYDYNGNLTKIIDPHGNETIFEYDVNDRLVKKTSPLGFETSMGYDVNGNLISEIDPNGNNKSYEYDTMNRMVKKILPDNIYNIVYDENENITSISDSDSNISYTYEKIGSDYFVTSETVVNTDMPSSTLNYTYNDEGIKTATNTPYGNFSYSYDNTNRLTGITNHKGESFGFIYDNANRLKQINRPGSKTVITVDDNGFLTNIDHLKTNNNPISQFAYTRDALGNRTSVTSTFGTKSFGYDNLNQLTSASNSEATGDYLNEVFTYDNLGNRLSSSHGSYNYDAKKARITSDYKYNYVHDNNGNLTIRQEKANNLNFTNYNYNSENQLTSIEEYTNNSLIKTHNYFYDAVGRRYKKEITDHVHSANSYERKYVFDNQEILSELDENDDLLAVYTHSMLRTDDVLAVDVKDTKVAALGSYFFTKDAIGSISEILDSSGSLIQRYVYSSFGKILKVADSAGIDITSNPLVKTNYGFTNREHDVSGLMYYRARYMMNEIGRFMQEDPHPGVKVNPITINNKFIYTGNNPVMNVDPDGRFIVTAAIVGAVLGGAFAALTGGNILEGILVGAVAGALGGVVGGAVSAGIAPTVASFTGSSVVGMIVGTTAGIGAGAFVGALTGGLTGGIISTLKGDSFDDGFSRGVITGLVAGAITGGYGGYSFFSGAKAPGGALGAFIKKEAYLFLLPSTLIPTIVAKTGEALDDKEPENDILGFNI